MPEQRKAYWRFDRDQTNRVSTERVGRGQPRADKESPVAQYGAGRAPSRESEGYRNGAKHPSQLRSAIDGGQARDKVAYPDPAAAPLGTDDEAAGTSPAPRRVQMAAEHEMAHDASPAVVTDPDRGRSIGLFLTIIAAAALAAVGVAAVLA